MVPEFGRVTSGVPVKKLTNDGISWGLVTEGTVAEAFVFAGDALDLRQALFDCRLFSSLINASTGRFAIAR